MQNSYNMVKIRLLRKGKKHAPFYRIVVIDSKKPRDGGYIESLGWYNPRGKEVKLNLDSVKEWITKGAQPTAIVAKLMKRKEAESNEGTN